MGVSKTWGIREKGDIMGRLPGQAEVSGLGVGGEPQKDAWLGKVICYLRHYK